MNSPRSSVLCGLWSSRATELANFRFQRTANLNDRKITLILQLNVHGSMSDHETSHFLGAVTLKTMKPPVYSRLFRNVSIWEKVFLVT